MRSSRPMLRLAGAALLCALVLPGIAAAALADDAAAMRDLESAARQKSLALLSVLKNMRPEFEQGASTVTMARIVSVASEVREARSLDSRVILNPNLNDEFEVIDRDDTRVRLDLGDGRTGWIDESHLQIFEQERTGEVLSFHGMDEQQLRRYAIVADELLAGIDEDREAADGILAEYAGDESEAGQLRSLRGAHQMIVEYQAYAHHFHDKYILGYDFSLENERGFVDNLSAWAELLAGQSSFTTTTPNDETKVDGSLRRLSIGGNLEINERSSARASASKKQEINQTKYETSTLAAGYSRDVGETSHLDLDADTYAYTDDLDSFKDFRRTTLRAGSFQNRADRKLRLGYTNTAQRFKENDAEDFTSHGLDATALWKRGPAATLEGRMLAVFESSDVAYHDFMHLTPSLEYARRAGGRRTSWQGRYEMFRYQDADLRSFGRASVSYDRSERDGPRSSRSTYALAHKNFPDNPPASYVQLRAAWSRNRSGAESRRRSLSTYTNYYPDRSENGYTDLRIGLGSTVEGIERDVTVYSRLWHQPGDPDDGTAKPYVADAFGKYLFSRGSLHFGPTAGVHVVAAKGSRVIKQDGNLFRLGALVEGRFSLPRRGSLTVNASYDYGFVYSDQIAIDAFTGDVTVDDTVQRHPTTFQANAIGSMPLNRNFSMTSRLTVYRIATDMDDEISANPVTNNDRFTLFVGVRYRHN